MTSPATTRAAKPEHRVAFYDTDARLVASAAAFLAPALGCGTVVVVATAAHCSAITAALPAGDPAAAGLIVTLNAEELLDRFMVDDSPDDEAFRAALGEILDDLTGPVLIYGEMVALLWDEGNVGAAIALEDLWNDLAAELSFGLLCGYPFVLFGDGRSPDFDAVCGRHTDVHVDQDSVLAPPQLLSVTLEGDETVECWQFPHAFTSGAQARRQLRDLLHQWQLVYLIDDAALLVTELVNNAVLHATSPVLVNVRRRAGRLRIEVVDVGGGMPQRRPATPHATTGRGLALVDSIAVTWGADADGPSKTVWFELPLG